MLKIVFMGTPEFSVPILEALIEKYDVIGVVTQPDKEVGRKRELKPSPVKECALRHNLKLFQPVKIRQEYQEIIDLNPDLIVTAAYGQIVGMKLLNSPKYCSINVHASLLPKYRGGAPIHEAIRNGEKETGVTIMYMEKAMDAGDILSQRSIPILDSDNCGTMFEKLSILGRDLLMETIPLLIENKITPIKQDESKVTFAYNISKEQEQLDFNKTARELFNQIRGFNPNPGSYMMLGNEPLKIYDSRVSEKSHHQEVGKIIEVGKKTFFISCGENTVLEVLEVCPFGKKRMKSVDFINGGLRKYLDKR